MRNKICYIESLNNYFRYDMRVDHYAIYEEGDEIILRLNYHQNDLNKFHSWKMEVWRLYETNDSCYIDTMAKAIYNQFLNIYMNGINEKYK